MKSINLKFKTSSLRNGNAMIFPMVIGVVAVFFVYIFWLWFFCRFYVGPDRMAIITAKAGKPLVAGQILAEKGQKGVWKDVFGEGRYFLNPFLYEREIKPVVRIEVGKVGIVTAKIGDELPVGEFLAEKGQKGIQKAVLGPGKYRLNPYGYSVEVVDALQIPIGYVGVVTSLSGKETSEGVFAKKGEKGVFQNVLQPGLYYINPKQYKVDILEIGTNQISLVGAKEAMTGGRLPEQEVVRTKHLAGMADQLVVQNVAVEEKMERNMEKQRIYKDSLLLQSAPSKSVDTRAGAKFSAEKMASKPVVQQASQVVQFIEFPSKDGFDIRLDITVEFEFMPENIASIFMKYGDLFQVVEKIILPQILSISRLKGSAYGARDFIVGEGREKFQDDLYLKIQETLSQKGIGILSALIRHVIVPDDIRKPIQDASVAIETNLTNIEKQDTAKKLAELNTELSMIAQKGEQVQQETQKIKAEIKAEEDKKVAEINATTLKLVSEIEKQTAEIQADKTRKIAKAESDVVRMIGLAEAEGFKMKVGALGDPNAYSLYEFSRSLPKDLNLVIAHTGQGTLWTDLNKTLSGELAGMKILEMGNEKKVKQ